MKKVSFGIKSIRSKVNGEFSVIRNGKKAPCDLSEDKCGCKDCKSNRIKNKE